MKRRAPKRYRNPSFDRAIREKRTRQEATLMQKAGQRLAVPQLIEVKGFDILMAYVEGQRPEVSEKTATLMGEMLKEMHSTGVVHNDFTPANVLVADEPTAIDFGLGYYSNRTEDRATDLFTTAYSLRPFSQEVVDAYGVEPVIRRYEEMKKRARYAAKL